MASHEELVAELPKLEKMSNAARLKIAKKRRLKQLRKYTETERARLVMAHNEKKRKQTNRINFEVTSLLQDAVQQNNLEEVAKLLEQNINCNTCNADGLTPLHRCCIENTVDMAKLLIDHGANLNARDIEGWTPLHAASACGNLPMINLLISSGANLVAINHDDKMPVDVACDSDIRYFIQQKMLEGGFTDDVCQYMRDSVPKTMLADLKESVKNGGSVNAQDQYGGSFLHIAAANGYVDVMEFILSQPNVIINIQDNEGWTPFHAAVFWEQKESMKLLAEKKADLERQDIHGDTPYAVCECPETRKYIIELKQQFTAPQSISLTPSVSREDLIGSADSRGRIRTLSVRRHSLADKSNDIKRITTRDEKLMLQRSLEAEDIERTASGEKLEDDILLADMELLIASGGCGPSSPSEMKPDSPTSPKFNLPLSSDVQETSLNEPKTISPRDSIRSSLSSHPTSPTKLEDGMLEREIDRELQEDRKIIVSILRNKNKTPIKHDSLYPADEVPLSPNNQNSLRINRPPRHDGCCVIL